MKNKTESFEKIYKNLNGARQFSHPPRFKFNFLDRDENAYK